MPPRIEGTDLIFPSTKRQPLSDMTMTAVMRRMNVTAVPHGFRSTFRDWAREKTNFPRKLAEQALARTLVSVASRTIIRPLIEQFRISLVPLLHGLHRRFALQR